jgi:hypothetical protein
MIDDAESTCRLYEVARAIRISSTTLNSYVLKLEGGVLWNKYTYIDRRMGYLAGLADVACNITQEKVKVGTLYEIKYALY